VEHEAAKPSPNLAFPQKAVVPNHERAAITSVRLTASILLNFLPLRPFICYPIAAFESESVVEQLLANQLALPLVPPNPSSVNKLKGNK
jgi:hypothetical protein